MLELRHLRSLQAIADTRTLAEAAERVHLTPSALSHQIRVLEQHYGMSLFERLPRGLSLTAAGERLLALAAVALPIVADAERDLLRLRGDARGHLRIVLECHTCFDWLMPVLDEFRRRWPEVEVDLVAGFHSDPLALLREGRADVVIGAAPAKRAQLVVQPLFRFEILLVTSPEHALSHKRHIEARDLRDETLITYPVPDERIDLIREVLKPARVKPARRTAELTIAIMQLVASGRGVAALPNWGVKSYVDHDYVAARRIGKGGLWSELHAMSSRAVADRLYFAEFVQIVREVCQRQLDGITLLAPEARIRI